MFAFYNLAPQTAGHWVAKHKKEYPSEDERNAAGQAAEVARLKKHVRKLQQGCEFSMKSGGLTREGVKATQKVRGHRSQGR